jgi:hypothetical protein
MLLYADEDFALPVVQELRRAGHDVITAQEDGQRSQPDDVILARAHGLGRAVLTYNRGDFERLDRAGAPIVASCPPPTTVTSPLWPHAFTLFLPS